MRLALLYGVPYLWVHYWIVAITCLHHTRPDVPCLAHQRWSYMERSLCTVDRSFGVLCQYLFHRILETHVIHHLLPKIPFCYAEEATAAIAPLLGKYR